MIPVSSLHYAILQQANHTDSEYLNQILAPQRDYYINKAKDIVLAWLINEDETNATVRRHLEQLVYRGKKLNATKLKNEVLAEYPLDYYKIKSLQGVASRSDCSKERLIKISRPTSEKFQAARRNSNTNRVWDFEQTFAQEAADGLHLMSEDSINLDVFADYIRKVDDVAYASGAEGGSYIRHDGVPITKDKNLDLDGSFFFSKIVGMAVLEIKRDYSHTKDYTTEREFILSFDRI